MTAFLNDLKVSRWLTRVPYPYACSDALDYINRITAEPKLSWAIHVARGLAGMIGFDNDLGYWLGRRAWGQGYATEAVLAVRFADAAITKIASSCFQSNAANVRVLEKLGFVEGAPGIGQSVSRGGDWPIRTFALSRPATP